MRVTYRDQNTRDYWEERWSAISADQPMENLSVYPLRYAAVTIQSAKGKILEAGCGTGRVLRYYKERGRDIVGMDYVQVAIEKLRAVDPELQVEVGDIRALSFPSGTFRYVLAFGLYHNLESGLDEAIRETGRVLEPGGKVCASFRADNIQTRLTDWLKAHRRRGNGKIETAKQFHKMNLKRSEFVRLFERARFVVERVFPVENMPILYQFAFFRARSHKVFNESLGRKEGYLLSPLGDFIQRVLMRFLPYQFCNVFVLIARKP